MFNTHDLDIHVNTIKGWIESCILPEQLLLCQNAIEQMIARKFRIDIDYFVLEAAIDYLNECIEDQRLIIASVTTVQRLQLLNKYRLQYQSQQPQLP